MNINEKELAALQKQVHANRLGLVVVSIDLALYRAQIAQRRWGTPGGNDVALQHYDQILEVLAQSDWPAELDGEVQEFESRVTVFRSLLKAQDVTRVSFEGTRMANAFRDLKTGLLAWAAASA